MSSKETILNAIRQQLPQSIELPSLDQQWTTYDDPIAQFSEMLSGVGGDPQHVPNLQAVQEYLNQTEAYTSGKQICHGIEGLEGGNVMLSEIEDAHLLETVDFAVLPAEFAVAENAAVWVNVENVRHRAIYFISQHVAIVVPASQVVSNMHEAYKRLQFTSETSYGVFISGPSKTADIEQSLVIGAHGARSQIVFLVDELG
jgi:L-lactate dehydrogenase complex protein LldG